VHSERREERDDAPDSPLVTMDGDVMGTPAYMPPEQARGEIEKLSPRSDVYSIGAMLYHLLARRTPYVSAGERPTHRELLARVRAGPPAPLHELNADVPAELVAICEKAMARDAEERYADTLAFAEDLRAYLEGRVVAAYETGAVAELRKWIARNRALAGSIAGAFALSLGLLAAVAFLGSKSRARLQLVADARAPATLLARAAEIVPSGPDQVVPLEGWLREAQDLLDRGRGYARELEELRARALPVDPDDPRERAARRRAEARAEDVRHVRDYYRREILRMEQVGGLSSELLTEPEVRARLQSLEQKAVETETLLPERVTWSYADPEDQLRFDALQALVPALAPFVDTPDAEGLVRRMERRLEFARSVEDRSFRDAREAWERAIASIGDVRDSPAYGGASIRPQLGLVPLRRDPESGLWEFLHLQSGAAPAIGPDGRWVLGDETGIVLVLIPGGEFLMGAQSDDPSRPNFDPEAEADESAFFEGGRQAFPAVLEPYFISKYEVTQAQWRRLAGRDPSSSTSALRPHHVHSPLHPVEHVAWKEAREVLLEVGLELPTEARWEFAARSGTATPWWTGRERESLRGAANVADRRSAESWEATARDKADWTALDDGFVLHAPVGSFRPNAYGLFDVCGNVSEWCSDSGFVTYDRYTEVHYGDLERQIWSEGLRVRRGGSFATRAALARSSARAFSGPEDTREDTGVRPARDLD